MRKLASIQRVTALTPIPGADLIETAHVLGWTCVVKKGEFDVGDKGVYLEIDAVPPDTDQFRFLWKSEERPHNFRIRTVKLRGQLSQGLLLPLSAFNEGTGNIVFRAGAHAEGDDLTEALGVTKYEPPMSFAQGSLAGQFLEGVPKTDEERVQSETGARLLAELQGRPYEISMKLDGCSMTVGIDHEGVFQVCSRNYRLRDDGGSVYWEVAKRDALEDLLRDRLNDGYRVALQGELCGPGIQSNRLGLSQPTFFVFGAVNMDTGHRLGQPLVDALTHWTWGPDQRHRLQRVPVIERGSSFSYTQDDLLALAEGKYPGTSNEREGIVIREDCTMVQGVSFKAISNRYLLKGGE